MDGSFPAVVLMLALLAGCGVPPAERYGPGGSAPPPQAGALPSTRAPANAHTLQDLIRIFAGARGASWDAYKTSQGIDWRDQAPREYAPGRFAVEGAMRLQGFPNAPLPDGQAGSDAGVILGNEGDAGVTLDGTRDAVDTISVTKFYMDSDYLSQLQRQFGTEVQIAPIKGTCQSDSAGAGLAYFEMTMTQGAHVLVEASTEEAGQAGPGYTIFEFTRLAPVEKVNGQGCK